MKHLMSLIIIIGALGCSSPPKQEEASVTSPGLDPMEANASETSEVLARKEPGAKKCPKKAKLVKGKCLLPVEETE